MILCVNIDHIATLRQARGGAEPNVIEGAKICEENGAGGITIHLREDRRHIQDKDVLALKEIVKGKYNLEMALSDDVIEIAKKVKPDQITLVPEKREELTTEGGLDVEQNFHNIKKLINIFHDNGVIVSLFIEPDKRIVELSKETGADFIEIHTGAYCDAVEPDMLKKEIDRIYEAANYGLELGIRINAGHGLNYLNINPVLKTKGLEELNIGHSIISRSIFVGLAEAVREMIRLINDNQ
ncbi:MAG: pyridoxine 5'-phosphate synthase [Spirochaetota bacterium]|nr:pyridoxine 5'-phosphate synthase [Spirochaetota bacterium]